MDPAAQSPASGHGRHLLDARPPAQARRALRAVDAAHRRAGGTADWPVTRGEPWRESRGRRRVPRRWRRRRCPGPETARRVRRASAFADPAPPAAWLPVRDRRRGRDRGRVAITNGCAHVRRRVPFVVDDRPSTPRAARRARNVLRHDRMAWRRAPRLQADAGRLLDAGEVEALAARGWTSARTASAIPTCATSTTPDWRRARRSRGRCSKRSRDARVRRWRIPYGLYDERVQQAAEAAGYELAWAWLPARGTRWRRRAFRLHRATEHGACTQAPRDPPARPMTPRGISYESLPNRSSVPSFSAAGSLRSACCEAWDGQACDRSSSRGPTIQRGAPAGCGDERSRFPSPSTRRR